MWKQGGTYTYKVVSLRKAPLWEHLTCSEQELVLKPSSMCWVNKSTPSKNTQIPRVGKARRLKCIALPTRTAEQHFKQTAPGRGKPGESCAGRTSSSSENKAPVRPRCLPASSWDGNGNPFSAGQCPFQTAHGGLSKEQSP